MPIRFKFTTTRSIIAADPRIKTDRNSTDDKKAAAEDKPDEKTKPGEKPASEAASDAKSAAGDTPDSRPDWARKPAHREGDSYILVVQAKGTDPLMREQLLDAKMVYETNQYINDALYSHGNVAAVVNIDADYLRKNCVHKPPVTVDSGNGETTVYAQLEFDNSFKNEVDRRLRSFISRDRVTQLGEIALAGFIGLGSLYALLKFKPKKNADKATDSSATAA